MSDEGIAVGTVSAVVASVLTWLGVRRKASRDEVIAQAEREAREADVHGKVRVASFEFNGQIAPLLFERIGELEERLDKSQTEHARQRIEDREKCDDEIRKMREELEGEIGQVAYRVRRTMRDDDTGVHLIDEIARRRSTRPPPLPGGES